MWTDADDTFLAAARITRVGASSWTEDADTLLGTAVVGDLTPFVPNPRRTSSIAADARRLPVGAESRLDVVPAVRREEVMQ